MTFINNKMLHNLVFVFLFAPYFNAAPLESPGFQNPIPVVALPKMLVTSTETPQTTIPLNASTEPEAIIISTETPQTPIALNASTEPEAIVTLTDNPPTPIPTKAATEPEAIVTDINGPIPNSSQSPIMTKATLQPEAIVTSTDNPPTNATTEPETIASDRNALLPNSSKSPILTSTPTEPKNENINPGSNLQSNEKIWTESNLGNIIDVIISNVTGGDTTPTDSPLTPTTMKAVPEPEIYHTLNLLINQGILNESNTASIIDIIRDAGRALEKDNKLFENFIHLYRKKDPVMLAFTSLLILTSLLCSWLLIKMYLQRARYQSNIMEMSTMTH